MSKLESTLKKHPFETEVSVRFRDGDPAQIMYFGHIFSLAHDAFEELIVQAGYQWSEWFQAKDYIYPIRHTEADFKIPFRPGHKYKIQAAVASFGQSSFVMNYQFLSEQGLHATVKMVHSCLELKSKQKSDLPPVLRQRLEPYHE